MADDGSYDVVGNSGMDNPDDIAKDTESETKPAFSVWKAIGQHNITDMLTDEQLKTIASDVIRDYDADNSAFGPRRKKIEELYALALQIVEEKNYPWQGAANIKYPLLTKAVLAFSALAYPAIVKDSSVVKGKTVGSDEGMGTVMGQDGQPMIDQDTGKEMKKNAGLKGKRASRVSTFMSHQILEDMDGWEDEMDTLLVILAVIGGGFKKSFYDPIDRTNVSDLVLPQHLVFSPGSKTPAKASRASELVEFFPHEIETAIRAGVFREFDYSMTPTETMESAAPMSGNRQEQPSAMQEDVSKAHLFIEQHRRLDLDDDGYDEPYIVWVHKEKSETARILPRYDAEHIHVMLEAGKASGKEAQDRESGEIIKIEAECYYSAFKFFPDPQGSIHGRGFGDYLQHVNEAVNGGINQMLDAGQMSMLGAGFVGTGFKVKSGELKFKPREWKRVDTGGMAMRDAVMPLTLPGPSPEMMALIEFLIKSAEDMSLTTQIMAGDMPANMPATTALASIEQGLQPFKAVFRRVHRGLKAEFKRLYYLNQKYLTQEEYTRVMDDPEADVEKDFNSADVDVLPISDPDFVTDIQSMIRAQVLEGYKDDPLVDAVEVRRRVFKAAGIKDADQLVKIPPKVTDEVEEATKASLMSQIEKTNRDNERADIETVLKIEEAMANIRLKLAQAAKALAEAESIEGADDVKLLMQELEHQQRRIESYATIAGRMGRMEAAPNNGQVSGVPA